MASGITDEKLNEFADALGVDKKLPTLGLKLGFRQSKVDLYLGTNKKNDSSEGTSAMLFDWKRQTPRAEQIPKLVKALNESDLAGLAEEFFPEAGQNHVAAASTSSPNTPAATNNSGRKPTDDEITELSVLLPHGKYSKFCGILGFKFNKHQAILTQKQNNYAAAYEVLLQEWNDEDDEGNTVQDLDAALEKAGLGGLKPQYKK